MSQPPPLPDLARLSDAEKDALILDLWRTVAAVQQDAGGEPQWRYADAPSSTGDLRARIAGTAPSRRGAIRSQRTGRNGIWSGLLESGLVLGILVVIGLGFIADFGIGWYQRHAGEELRHAELKLHQAAFGGLDVQLVDVAYAPDGKSYRVTLSMRNQNPDGPLYIMLNPAQVYVQTGLVWHGVPTRAAPGTTWGVVKLDDAGTIGMDFQVDVDDWTALLPGYMHLRIQSDMLISRSDQPKDDLVERINRFNVYLKPRGADDAEIKRRLDFPGTPPVFIPMPPH
jgi:hypothetical protein